MAVAVTRKPDGGSVTDVSVVLNVTNRFVAGSRGGSVAIVDLSGVPFAATSEIAARNTFVPTSLTAHAISMDTDPIDGETWRLTSSYPSPIERLDLELAHAVPGEAQAEPQTGAAAEARVDDTRPRKLALSDQDIVAFGIVEDGDKLLVSGYTLQPGMMEMMRQTITSVAMAWEPSMSSHLLVTAALDPVGPAKRYAVLRWVPHGDTLRRTR